MRCANCATENPVEARFCIECGQPLAATCANCGTPLPPRARFCFSCGEAVGRPAPPVETASVTLTSRTDASDLSATPTTELRQVSVLFCDLVGFTTLSESRDPEEVRELLSGYFDLARSVISRYGGTVEKFIGDAVMAVWGAPVAREDDAERAVRASLELLSAISAYGEEHGTPLDARVGIATGSAATTTPEEGMVIGDRVNTAARIQSVAAPRSCLVDDATRHASSAAIVYRDAGTHELKGKSEGVHLNEALRVVAMVGGALKSEGLEAPFVGRDAELRLVKELFHAAVEQQRAHLVSIVGVAGIGKSRLAWEVFKYVDGLSDLFLGHRGRCLAYGEGVTYWALAEMVRSRAGIVEGEDAAVASGKLQDVVAQHVSDAEERRWVEARLAQLLAIDTRTSFDREDLFAGWRLFFERMAESHALILSFEDMQWADSALLDFIEYLLEWSRNHPIFVLTLTRPELLERRSNWGAAHRNFTSIALEPLSPAAMRELVSGLVPGLPKEIRERILERAEGIPLYAVETIRMLIDRGLLVADDGSYRPVGPIETLEIPETLQALIAARLDGLVDTERRLIQEAAVLGKTFTKDGIARLSGIPADALSAALDALIRKELITVQADPRSPERGHYTFVQDLVRKIAYESLPKRDRREKHLAAAAYLEDAFGIDDLEVVEIFASHYRAAFELSPNAEDAEQVRSRACKLTIRAGERAAALADAVGAQRYFQQAIELTDDELDRAKLEERAGQMAMLAGGRASARTHFERAASLYELMGATHAGARVAARLGEIDFEELHMNQGIERMEKAFALLSEEEPDADLVTLAAQLGRLHLFAGAPDVALQRIEFALRHAEKLRLREQFVEALNTKSVLLHWNRRDEEGMLLVRHALAVALEEGIPQSALRAYNNVIAYLAGADRYKDLVTVTSEALEYSRRIGDRKWESLFLSSEMDNCVDLGDWDRAIEILAQLRDAPEFWGFLMGRMTYVQHVFIERGDLESAKELLEATRELENADDTQMRPGFLGAKALVLRAEGKLDEALDAANESVASALLVGKNEWRGLIVDLFDVAYDADRDRAMEVLHEIESLSPGDSSASLQALAGRFRARLSPNPHDEDFAFAIDTFRELGMQFYLAVTLVDYAEALADHGRPERATAYFHEAREIFERLGATPWIERVRRADERSPAE